MVERRTVRATSIATTIRKTPAKTHSNQSVRLAGGSPVAGRKGSGVEVRLDEPGGGFTNTEVAVGVGVSVGVGVKVIIGGGGGGSVSVGVAVLVEVGVGVNVIGGWLPVGVMVGVAVWVSVAVGVIPRISAAVAVPGLPNMRTNMNDKRTKLSMGFTWFINRSSIEINFW